MESSDGKEGNGFGSGGLVVTYVPTSGFLFY